jgi:hypothetical protein
MPFLLFEHKSASSLEIPPLACNELITKIDHDFPPYVQQLPCIYDVIHRKCHHGHDACIEYLTQFATPAPEPIVVVPEPDIEQDPEPVPEEVSTQRVEVDVPTKPKRARKPKKSTIV